MNTASPEADDLELARRVRAGEPEALAGFLELLPGLVRFVDRLLPGHPDAANDVVQATLGHALASLGSFRGEAPLAAWLRGIARNELRGLRRRLGRDARTDALEEESPELVGRSVPGRPTDPETALEVARRSRRVHDVLDLIHPRHAAALEAKYVHGMSVAEIARRDGLSEKTVESLLTRAREAFRRQWQRGPDEGLRAPDRPAPDPHPAAFAPPETRR